MGAPLTQFRTLADTQTRIFGAAYPIFSGEDVMGAVVVDQNMNGLRTFPKSGARATFQHYACCDVSGCFRLVFFASRNFFRVRF